MNIFGVWTQGESIISKLSYKGVWLWTLNWMNKGDKD